MLQMRVYSERTSAINGIITNVGEDAHPFVNNAGMFVADGMGGSAGVPILRFDERCFDEDTLSKMLCDYFSFNSAEDKEEFCVYSKENFSSLSNPVMKEFYRNPTGNTLRLKKSGYVGSHVLGAVFAAMLIHLSSSNNYSQLDVSLWKETVEKYRDSMFEQYKKVISVLDSEYVRGSLDKIDYYGTTMAGVFFKENEDSVDAIFLNCGDSRSYVWDSNGFRQACDDQGRNGGMTSRFSLGKEVKVRISCEVRNYKKPCSFLCMTDGFYGVFGGKDGFHSTPLYMEGFLMNVLSTQSSIEDAASRLKSVFDTKGQIDDSNSMVMASFGYNTYEELKEAAKNRMDYINREYCLTSMPDDFLLVDYKKIVSDLQEASADSIKPLLKEAYKDEGVRSYCLTQIDQIANAAKYKQEIRRIDDKIAAVKESNGEIKKTLYVIVQQNFTDFEDIESVGQSIFTKWKNNVKGTSLEDARYYGREFSSDYHFRTKTIEGLGEELAALTNKIKEKTDSITINIEAPWVKATEDETSAWVRTTREGLSESFRRLQDKLSNVVKYSKNLTEDREKWEQINSILMNDYLAKGGESSPQRIVDNWLKDAFVIEDAIIDTTIPSVRFAIIKLVKQYLENLEEIEQMDIERVQAVEIAARNYWEDNSCKDIHKLLRNDKCFEFNTLLKQQIMDTLDQNEDLTKYEKLSQMQSEVFERYLKLHLSETSEDKVLDVEKNGWM